MPSRRAFVPLAFVYFVKPRSIARLPASPTAAGVAKSGSPGPKSTTSTPWAMRAVARLRTASVGDSCIVETRSEKRMPARATVVISAAILIIKALVRGLLVVDDRRVMLGDVGRVGKSRLLGDEPRMDE